MLTTTPQYLLGPLGPENEGAGLTPPPIKRQGDQPGRMALAITKTIATAQSEPRNQIDRPGGGLERNVIERLLPGREAGARCLSAAGGLEFSVPAMSTAYAWLAVQPHEFAVRFRNGPRA